MKSTRTKRYGRLGMFLLFMLVLFSMISAGYFYTVNKTKLEANVKIKKPVWKIKFTDVRTLNILGKAQNYRMPLLADESVSLFASFEEPGDTINYKVRISNVGNLNARLTGINIISRLTNVIDFEYDDIEEGDVLKTSENKDFRIKIRYNPNASEINQVEDKILLIFSWEQA